MTFDATPVTYAPNLEGLTMENKELQGRVKQLHEEASALEKQLRIAMNALSYIAHTNHCQTCSLVASGALDDVSKS